MAWLMTNEFWWTDNRVFFCCKSIFKDTLGMETWWLSPLLTTKDFNQSMACVSGSVMLHKQHSTYQSERYRIAKSHTKIESHYLNICYLSPVISDRSYKTIWNWLVHALQRVSHLSMEDWISKARTVLTVERDVEAQQIRLFISPKEEPWPNCIILQI